MLNTRAGDAHLRQLAISRAPDLVRLLPLVLAPPLKLSDFVGLILGGSLVHGVHHGASVSIVLRGELDRSISRADARSVPVGRPDALPIFVKDRGASHAFLLPITDELCEQLGLGGPAPPSVRDPIAEAELKARSTDLDRSRLRHRPHPAQTHAPASIPSTSTAFAHRGHTNRRCGLCTVPWPAISTSATSATTSPCSRRTLVIAR